MAIRSLPVNQDVVLVYQGVKWCIVNIFFPFFSVSVAIDAFTNHKCSIGLLLSISEQENAVSSLQNQIVLLCYAFIGKRVMISSPCHARMGFIITCFL